MGAAVRFYAGRHGAMKKKEAGPSVFLTALTLPSLLACFHSKTQPGGYFDSDESSLSSTLIRALRIWTCVSPRLSS
jgi:hypothetical protein